MKTLALLALSSSLLSQPNVSFLAEKPLTADQAFKTSHAVSGRNLQLRFTIEEDHYLYQEKFSATTISGDPLYIVYPSAPEEHFDEFFGATKVYHNEAMLFIRLPRHHTESINISFQGCKSKSICYPPTTKEIELHSNQNSTQRE